MTPAVTIALRRMDVAKGDGPAWCAVLGYS